MTQGPAVTTTIDGRVAILRYANPPSGLIPNKGAALLLDAVVAQLDDPKIGAVVITGGEPGVFIRHADVSQIQRAGEAVASRVVDAESFAHSPFARLGQRLDAAEKPVIAAINGVCMGGGLEIALACTLRIAAAGAKPIGLPEIRIGLFPGSGGIARLSRLIGRHRARRFALDGAVVDAGTALAMGIVDELATDALERAVDIAKTYAARNPVAVQSILELARVTTESEAIERSMVLFGELVGGSPELRRGLGDFLSGSQTLDQMP